MAYRWSITGIWSPSLSFFCFVRRAGLLRPFLFLFTPGAFGLILTGDPLVTSWSSNAQNCSEMRSLHMSLSLGELIGCPLSSQFLKLGTFRPFQWWCLDLYSVMWGFWKWHHAKHFLRDVRGSLRHAKITILPQLWTSDQHESFDDVQTLHFTT